MRRERSGEEMQPASNVWGMRSKERWQSWSDRQHAQSIAFQNDGEKLVRFGLSYVARLKF
jgi:hypothetical protein